MNENNYKTILFLATPAIGDCLLATCIPHSLRKAYPDAKIDVLVPDSRGELVFSKNEDINDVIVMGLKPTLKQYLTFIRKYWRSYDLVVNDRSSDRSAIYAFITGKKRIGVIDSRHSSAKFKKILFSNYIIESDDIEHRLMRNLRILDPLGIKKYPVVIVPEDKQTNLQKEFNIPTKYIVLHSPSSNEIKQWPVSHWAELTKQLLDKGYFLAITGGKTETEKEIVEAIINEQQQNNVINLSGKISFAQLSTLIKNSQGFIGPDCGPAHLASSVNIPIFTIFGPTPVSMWSPWPYKKEQEKSGFIAKIPTTTIDNITVFQSSRECVPCYGKRCTIKKTQYSPCLEDIKPMQVFNAVIDIIPLNPPISPVTKASQL